MKPQSYLFGKYVHKSLNYLYPLLGIDRKAPFPPSTFLNWGKEESIDNNRLIVIYEEDSVKSQLFEKFESKYLLGNPYYEKGYTLEEGRAYVFNLSPLKEVIDHFRQGKYSKFPEGVKKKILLFHGGSTDKTPRPGRYIHTTLYPELYFDKVAEEIGVKGLEEVGELTDPPNEEKEKIKLRIVSELVIQ